MKPVKQVYRHVIRTEWFRQFTLFERLRILFGYNLLVYIRIPCRHNAHTFQPIMGARTTKQQTPDAHLIEELERAVRESSGLMEISTEPNPPAKSTGQVPG